MQESNFETILGSPKSQTRPDLFGKRKSPFLNFPEQTGSSSVPFDGPSMYQSPKNQTDNRVMGREHYMEEIKLVEAHRTILQLQTTLLKSNEQLSILQESLQTEKSRNFDINEQKRRLEEELLRLQFELDRMGAYEHLEQRENAVRIESLTKENSRLSVQTTELLEELKKFRNQNRQLTSENEKLLSDNESLQRANKQLESQLNLIHTDMVKVKEDMRNVKGQFLGDSSNKSQINLDSEAEPKIQRSGLLQINSIQHPKMPIPQSKKSPINKSPLKPLNSPRQKQRIPEQKEDEDYEQLMQSNEEMQRLYELFYKAEHKGQNKGKDEQSFSNQKIKVELSKRESPRNDQKNISRDDPQPTQRRAKQNGGSLTHTGQKKYLVGEINKLREGLMSELRVKCYKKCVMRGEKQHRNALKLFVEELEKTIRIYEQMAMNYLQLRGTVSAETGETYPMPYDADSLKSPSDQWVDTVYKTVKDNAKKEANHPLGWHLALFRLLTLLDKVDQMPYVLLSHIEHTCLKYIHKIYQQKHPQK